MFVKQTFCKRIKLLLYIGFFFVNGLLFANTPLFKIYISDVQKEITQKFLGVPTSVNYTVYWDVFEENGDGLKPASIDLPFYFKPQCWDKKLSDIATSEDTIHGNYFTFKEKKVGRQYGILVEGFINVNRFAISDTAWVIAGRDIRAANSASLFRWFNWIPFNGRIPMALFGRGNIFDGATKPGKIAFHLIWNFLIAGCIVWFFFCIRFLSLRKIFPMKKQLHFTMGYDQVYQKGISEDFGQIMKEWRGVVEKTNEHVKKEIQQGNQLKVCDIEAENAKFWKEKGTTVIQKLLKKIKESKLEKYASVRIIHAGLENHELGGFRWLEVSKEVDRAIENRASSELEQLRRRSLVDWLWNLGTLAPLVGLFGTATGISHAFAMLTMLQADITQTTLVRRLASGIFEALWTTIEGLFVGIILMLLYYYYQNKLSWIYSKWEEIYVYVAEKL